MQPPAPLQAKFRHFDKVDAAKFSELWQLQQAEAGDLTRQLLAADRVITEQQLGWKWKGPDDSLFISPHDLSSPIGTAAAAAGGARTASGATARGSGGARCVGGGCSLNGALASAGASTSGAGGAGVDQGVGEGSLGFSEKRAAAVAVDEGLGGDHVASVLGRESDEGGCGEEVVGGLDAAGVQGLGTTTGRRLDGAAEVSRV